MDAFGSFVILDSYECRNLGSARRTPRCPEVQYHDATFETTKGNAGIGIGVYESREFIAELGGRLQVTSALGEGTTFTATLPLASGSAFVIALSPDEAQEWLYLADGTNHKVWVLRRSDLEVVGDFGRGGRQIGQFLRPHGMGVDSQGNIYIGEASTGRRIQKFSVN